MKVIKRRRSIKSCKYCYDHKLKCSKEQPCLNCKRHGKLALCMYGFDKEPHPAIPPPALNLDNNALFARSATKKMPTVAPNRPGPYYPFLLEAQQVSSLGLRDKDSANRPDMKRNAITRFNSLDEAKMSMDAILDMVPESKASMSLLVDNYFYRINPIIPLLDRDATLKQVKSFYELRQSGKKVAARDCIIMFTILFTVSYVHVAEGQIPDLLLCNRYYAAFQALLTYDSYPYETSVAAVQGALIVNFVVDPNMTNAVALSAVLLRHIQKLGVHKQIGLLSSETDGLKIHLQALWHFVLYLEGSSSVVAGLPFMHTAQAFDCVDLPGNEASAAIAHMAFANGRFLINRMFRVIMMYKDTGTVPVDDALVTVRNGFGKLSNQVEELCAKIESLKKGEAVYFISTLRVFLLRAFLRFEALFSSNSVRHQPVTENHDRDSNFFQVVDRVLQSGTITSKETVELSALLLFYTLRRLGVGNCPRFAWYSKGSTVMQYLFILLKAISQEPTESYSVSISNLAYPVVLSEDIVECISTDAVNFKYVLVEELFSLLETKLAPLWDDRDLDCFLLLRSVKDRVWELNKEYIGRSKASFESLRACDLFRVYQFETRTGGIQSSENDTQQWEFCNKTIDAENVMRWLSEL
ncbi:uncharacterized protein LALA0_S04e00694g [Lachancea lanzarotensis]|uniref:LALA0S04e00694g1_1 n=1 Tax=Lachancea lanzarotensis TaxID=1245769 RepID=A0A0C7N597_9SACH|nr:uncharacterized protein LALA0_S04e00694g [Lachancea lanzarotensis]CEP61788.1 LALA0S04e00694g1_1 [Lachancea lanzarotensis]